jgi:CubicO group peptidase (beta-lactamase class C family)
MTLNPALEIRQTLRNAIARHEMPGAVCVIGTSHRVLLREAAGWRMLTPERRPMRHDTIFDIASLTKVVATTPCVMKLIERKEMRISDRLSRFFPEFQQGAKRTVTIEHLLLHTSGLPGSRDYWRRASSKDEIISMCLAESLIQKPGERFEYSDLGFILLGEIVERVASESLADFARNNVFEPWGMPSTGFNPPKTFWLRCAATEVVSGKRLCGQVHDENARAMGGVAGHAGVFSTADDLVRFCQMILRRRAESPIRDMILPRRLPDGHRRALGWDVESAHSSPKGHLFGPRSFGHTGFTGTSIWMDPELDAFVVLLTNRVHLGREVNINGLRGKIGTLAALPFLRAGLQ